MSLSSLFSFLYGSPNQRAVITDIKNPYSDPDPIGICSGCRAKDAHIEDLRELLMLEKEQRDLLIGRVLGINQAPTQEVTSEASVNSVIRPGYASLSERRRQAAMKEAQANGASPSQHTQDFWARRKQNMLDEEKLLHERIAEAVARRAQEAKDKETKTENPHIHVGAEFVEGSAAVDKYPEPADITELAETRAELE